MANFAEFVKEADLDLKAGRILEVAKRLRAVNTAKVPREWRLPLANLSRRCSLWAVGLRLLTPLIYPEKYGSPDSANANEKAEYAALLMKNGAVKEALKINQSIDPKAVPEALLYRAFCFLNQWNYDQAIETLNQYINAQPSAYSAFVARVNLSAALVASERFDEALDLLNAAIAEAKAAGYNRLLANCLELRGQVHMSQDNVSASESDLQEASAILGSQGTSDQLFIAKWRAVLAAKQLGSIVPLTEFKGEALRRQHWESVRDCDFQALMIEFDQSRFEHLIWGTPFESYRQKVQANLGREITSNTYLLGPTGAPYLDLRSGDVHGAEGLSPGKKIHQRPGP